MKLKDGYKLIDINHNYIHSIDISKIEDFIELFNKLSDELLFRRQTYQDTFYQEDLLELKI